MVWLPTYLPTFFRKLINYYPAQTALGSSSMHKIVAISISFASRHQGDDVWACPRRRGKKDIKRYHCQILFSSELSSFKFKLFRLIV